MSPKKDSEENGFVQKKVTTLPHWTGGLPMKLTLLVFL